MSETEAFDVIIIGTGAAGLSTALRLNQKLRIAIISKRGIKDGNTLYAQGGISAVLHDSDSIESHVQDTLASGAGLCDESIVRLVVENGPHNIEWLLSNGVEFTRREENNPKSEFHLAREGGHSHRRVVHSADATGKTLENTLVKQARKRDNIEIYEHHIAVDLIVSAKKGKNRRVHGCYFLDIKTDKVTSLRAPFVVLATGAANKAYLYTSNPDVATGDGIAMAWRAGCRVANMEFIQFHPTCLYHPHAKSFLITEALRGEGATLHLSDGHRFMPHVDKGAELAPRDIVARAIDHEMKRTGADCVYLDISHKDSDFILSHFPTIYKRCLDLGIDITREPIPVVPAAHYTCGGVMTDKKARTDIIGLYAIGETAYTGLHGANRMASNSLLECLVFSEIAAKDIGEHHTYEQSMPETTPWDETRVVDSDEQVVVSHNWDELRRFMWDYVGIVRSNKRLARARHRVDLLRREIHEYYGNFRINNDLLELRNLVEVSDMIIRSARLRKESRGLHYTIDFPEPDMDQASPTILIPDNYAARTDQFN